MTFCSSVSFLFDQRTYCGAAVLPRSTAQQEPKLFAEQFKLPNLALKIGKMLTGQLLYLRTGCLASPRQLQKFSHLFKRDAQRLGSAHKVEQANGIFIVNPVAVRKARGRAQ
jgi:hypothetical protein